MIDFAYGMVVVYFVVCFLFAAQYVNDMRIVLNNQAPGHGFWGSTKFFSFRPSFALFRVNAASIDPESLTEFGRQYRERAIRHHHIMTIWAVGGFIIVAVLLSYAQGHWGH
jgi:hypothetical protein